MARRAFDDRTATLRTKAIQEVMPIHLDISHLDRVVIAVVIGDAGADEVRDLGRRFSEAGTRHYRKILDTTAGALIMSDAEVEALVAQLRARPKADERGPLAFLVDPRRPAPVAEKYTELTAGERPVKIFHSLHAARRWLDEHSTIALKR
jgi:hypothetical protein